MSEGASGGAAGLTVGGAAASGGPATGGSATGGAVMGGSAGEAGGSAAGSGGNGMSGVAGQTGACSVVHHVEIPFDLFGIDRYSGNYALARIGERFSVVQDGTSSTGHTGRATAVVSWQGIDAHWECMMDCPAGMTTAFTPDAGAPQMLTTNGTVTQAWDPDGNLLGSSTVVWPDASKIMSSLILSSMQAQFKGSKDGRRAIFAFGYPYFVAHGFFAAFAANAAKSGTEQTFDLEQWECFDELPTQTSGALSLATDPDGESQFAWSVRELDAAGSVAFESAVVVPNEDKGLSKCPQVIEGPAGYYARWGKRILAMNRAAGPGAAPSELTQASTQDRLVAVLDDEFLFEVRGKPARFIGARADGSPARELFALPQSSTLTAAEFSFIAAQGRSFFVSYRNGAARVFEEIACR